MSVNLIEEIRRLEREHTTICRKLATERDELQARVGELEAAVGSYLQDHQHMSAEHFCAVFHDVARRTPAQSVAHIEAAVLRWFCEEMEGKALYVGGDATGGVLWICKKGRERADRIEQGARS
jgi:hypothetical protein